MTLRPTILTINKPFIDRLLDFFFGRTDKNGRFWSEKASERALRYLLDPKKVYNIAATLLSPTLVLANSYSNPQQAICAELASLGVSRRLPVAAEGLVLHPETSKSFYDIWDVHFKSLCLYVTKSNPLAHSPKYIFLDPVNADLEVWLGSIYETTGLRLIADLPALSFRLTPRKWQSFMTVLKSLGGGTRISDPLGSVAMAQTWAEYWASFEKEVEIEDSNAGSLILKKKWMVGHF